MAATIDVICPHCSYRGMRASAQHVGRNAKCPNCQKIFAITRPGGDSGSAVSLVGAATERGQPAGGTNVNPLLAGAIGLAATVVLYAFFYILPETNFIHLLMTKRTFIQHTTTFVTCWGLAILGLKYAAVQRELRNSERELELIPLEVGLQITPANVEKFLDHIGQLSPEEQASSLARRLRGALGHFKHRNNVSEVQSYLATQADIEASAVDSGYTLLRVFIWVCPILGFIGTVWGISQGVEKMAKSLPEPTSAAAPVVPGAAEADRDKLIGGIRQVTGDLATAFDTTLLGLICVAVLMFPTEALKKTEYGMLDRVQGFANESLLRRMAEGGDAGGDSMMPTVVRQALESAFKEHQRWLAQWQAQVGKLGQEIGADFESHLAGVRDKMARSDSAGLEALSLAVRRVEELFGHLGQAASSVQKMSGTDFQHLIAAVTQLHQSLNTNSTALNQVLKSQAELLEKYSTADMGGAIHSLSVAVTQMVNRRPPGSPPGLLTRILGRSG